MNTLRRIWNYLNKAEAEAVAEITSGFHHMVDRLEHAIEARTQEIGKINVVIALQQDARFVHEQEVIAARAVADKIKALVS